MGKVALDPAFAETQFSLCKSLTAAEFLCWLGGQSNIHQVMPTSLARLCCSTRAGALCLALPPWLELEQYEGDG